MKTIHINASECYDVKIGSGLLSLAGQQIRSVTKGTTAVVVSDSNVFPLYGETVKCSLRNAGFSVLEYVIAVGEASKNGQVYLSLLNYLAQNHVTRSDCLIALGGGVVGDLTGFAAATYLRGIAYIQLPTTLLAAVDSSVGGKTAIDLPSGKNLAGAFYQPRLVLCDTDALATLPEDIFRDGCAEVIKYGILYDPDLFETLYMDGLAFQRESVISRCVELKCDVITQDEFDKGLRMKLNLGHTIGHGVEANSDFTVSHGKAVAIGTAIVARACASLGICTPETAKQILAVLSIFGLPTETNDTVDALHAAALSDKKRSGNAVNLIVIEKIGSCAICPTNVEDVKEFIKAGL